MAGSEVIRCLRVAMLSLVAVQALPPLVGPLIPDTTSTISGIVRRSDTGQPIAEAQVAVAAPGDSLDNVMLNAVLTDANGRFTIRRVTAGEYTVVAQREGYFKPPGDDPPSSRVRMDLTVFESQQIEGLVLELIPGAVIGGRVRDDDGRTITGAAIEILQPGYVRGRLLFSPVKSVETDDRGEYRLFWVPPGEYFVRGQYRLPLANHGERYPPVFFPGIAEEDRAPSIRVSPGTEASALDLRISTTPIAGVTISGRITTDDPELEGLQVSSVYVVARDRTVTVPADAADAFENEGQDRGGGQFLIRRVPPGSYNLFPVARDRKGQMHAARIPVDVAEENIEKLSAEISAGVALKGRVTLDGRVPEDRKTLAGGVIVASIDGLPPALLDPSGREAADGEVVARFPIELGTGEFLLPQLLPGRYVLRIGSPTFPPEAYLADVWQGIETIFNSGLTVGEDAPDPVVLALRSDGGAISGTVTDWSLLSRIAGAVVALVPDAPRRSNVALYRSVKAGPDGSFTLSGIAPGSYKVFAWESALAGAWENAAFLRRFEILGVAVSVPRGSSQTVRVSVPRP